MNKTSVTMRTTEANQMVKNYVVAALVVSLIPIPIFDLIALISIQLKLLHSLSKLYGIPYSANLGKSLIASLLGGLTSVRTGLFMTSATKSVPAVGTASGIAGVLVMSGASTYAIGKLFIQHFEAGGTFLNFDPEAVREHFAAEFERGKKVVEELQAGSPIESPAEILVTASPEVTPPTLSPVPPQSSPEPSPVPVVTLAKDTETTMVTAPLPTPEVSVNHDREVSMVIESSPSPDVSVAKETEENKAPETPINLEVSGVKETEEAKVTEPSSSPEVTMVVGKEVAEATVIESSERPEVSPVKDAEEPKVEEPKVEEPKIIDSSLNLATSATAETFPPVMEAPKIAEPMVPPSPVEETTSAEVEKVTTPQPAPAPTEFAVQPVSFAPATEAEPSADTVTKLHESPTTTIEESAATPVQVPPVAPVKEDKGSSKSRKRKRRNSWLGKIKWEDD